MGRSILSPVVLRVLRPPSVVNTSPWRSSSTRLSCLSNAVSITSVPSLYDGHGLGGTRRRIFTNKEQSINCRQRELGIASNRGPIEFLPKTRLSSRKALSELSAEKVAEKQDDEVSSLSQEIPDEQSAAAVIDESTLARIPSYQSPELGTRWLEFHGQNNWKDLLNPIDPVLRSELIRYGEFAQATYDAFDYDEHTRFTGSCRFSKERLLEKVQLLDSGYEVTDYIYSLAGEGVPKSFFKFLSSDNVGQLNVDEAWSRETNWQGYVAVATDAAEIERLGRRDILIAWRGTITNLEWLHNLQDKLVPGEMDPRRTGQSGTVDLKIEQGFLNLYIASDGNSPYTNQSARTQVLDAVRRLVGKYCDEKLSITVTGHSLGAALATLSAYDMAETGVNQADHLPDDLKKWKDLDVKTNPDDVVDLTRDPNAKTIPISVFSFAGPRVGNNAFRDRLNKLNVKVLRVVNKNDLVPKVPGLFVNEKTRWLDLLLDPVRAFLEALPWTYIHVGELFEIDSKKSPFLKDSNEVGDLHNLEGSYLHVLSGYQGADKDFLPNVVPRDLALVNKASALLLSKYFIPENWWYQQYKGLVRVKQNGVWATFPREREDYPEFYDPRLVEKEAVAHATPSSANA